MLHDLQILIRNKNILGLCRRTLVCQWWVKSVVEFAVGSKVDRVPHQTEAHDAPLGAKASCGNTRAESDAAEKPPTSRGSR